MLQRSEASGGKVDPGMYPFLYLSQYSNRINYDSRDQNPGQSPDIHPLSWLINTAEVSINLVKYLPENHQKT